MGEKGTGGVSDDLSGQHAAGVPSVFIEDRAFMAWMFSSANSFPDGDAIICIRGRR
jgi:hypothetical protein